jgi:uncharacterized protein with LGFP repeats
MALLLGVSVGTAATASAADCLEGSVNGRYSQLGGAAGSLGAVTSCEQGTPDGSGRYATFERGAIYSSPASGAWDVSGSFRQFWAATGWENGFLHYPTSGENPIRDRGVFQNYQGGTLYWSPATGAHSVSGAFLGLYGSQGYENGFLGYPTSQENPVRAGGVFQLFTGGVAYWSPASGAHTVSGSFRGLYGNLGYENGCLGYPTSQEFGISGGVQQNYQFGRMTWSPAAGPAASCGAVVTPAPNPTPAPTPNPGVYYANCTEARAAGAAPIFVGEPGYRPALDRDRDGIACE